MADTKLTSLPTATGPIANDAVVYIVDDLAASTATSLSAQFQDFQRIRYGTTTATDDYSAVLNDAYKAIISNATATHSIRIPSATDVAFPLGTWVHILQTATGQVTVSSTVTGVTFNSPASVNARTQNSMISLLLTSTATSGTWLLSGDLEPT